MRLLLNISGCILAALLLSVSGCKKDKKAQPEDPAVPPPTVNEQEVVTTLRIYLWDSITGVAVTGSPFSFKDPDGEGGQPGVFLNNEADTLITLDANTSYSTRVVILDETKTPADSISNEVEGDESYEHMVFYNGDPLNSTNIKGNQVLQSGYPNYTVRLNGSLIRLRYTDTDNGAVHSQPARNIGLRTILRTGAATSGSYPFTVTLRHQPGSKDGTYPPGETDVKVIFRIAVN